MSTRTRMQVKAWDLAPRLKTFSNFVLSRKRVKQEANLLRWATRFTQKMRVIKHTRIGEIRISTIFLGIDHSFGLVIDPKKPVVFETMIFNGEHDSYQERYCTYDAALHGHGIAVRLVKKSLNPPGL